MFGLTPYRKNGAVSRSDDFTGLRSIFDEFFNDSLFPSAFTTGNAIRADIRESEKEYIVDADIPGAKKEDIKLDLRDDVLTISVEHNEQINEEREGYIRKERRYGSCSRSFYVENINHEAVTAKYENGVLSIKLPKLEDGRTNKHKIDIQ